MKAEYIYMNLIAPLVILFPMVLGFYKFHYLPPSGKTLVFYLLVNAMTSAGSSFLAYKHLPNMPLVHLATILETLFLLNFFRKVFYHHALKELIQIIMILFPLAGIIDSLYFQSILTFNSYMLSLQSLLIILFCFLYWWNWESDQFLSWGANPLNWIICGLLLYFSSAFILFTFSNFIIPASTRKVLILLWNMHATLTIIMNVFITVGIKKFGNER